MGTVLLQDGFAVMIFVHDHLPPHVHIFKAGEQLIINLGGANTKPTVRENKGMTNQNERRALKLAAIHQPQLLLEWERLHGNA